MPHQRQVVRRRQPARSAAYHRDFFPGIRRVRQLDILSGMIDRKPLDPTDIHRVIDHVPAAALLAGVLAHIAADRRERIVLADQRYCLVKPLLLDQ